MKTDSIWQLFRRLCKMGLVGSREFPEDVFLSFGSPPQFMLVENPMAATHCVILEPELHFPEEFGSQNSLGKCCWNSTEKFMIPLLLHLLLTLLKYSALHEYWDDISHSWPPLDTHCNFIPLPSYFLAGSKPLPFLLGLFGRAGGGNTCD